MPSTMASAGVSGDDMRVSRTRPSAKWVAAPAVRKVIIPPALPQLQDHAGNGDFGHHEQSHGERTPSDRQRYEERRRRVPQPGSVGGLLGPDEPLRQEQPPARPDPQQVGRKTMASGGILGRSGGGLLGGSGAGTLGATITGPIQKRLTALQGAGTIQAKLQGALAA